MTTRRRTPRRLRAELWSDKRLREHVDTRPIAVHCPLCTEATRRGLVRRRLTLVRP